MIEETTKKYDELKNIIDLLPLNTKYNRKRKKDLLLEKIDEDKKSLELVKKEIESRLKKFDNISQNTKIEKISKEIENCKIVNEWNIYNRSYEKIHLDYYLYELDRFYKEDLDKVNECISRILDAFNKVGITLTKEDFDYNELASEYINKILTKVSNDELKETFEKIYWKNADILKIISANFRSIYLRYEKDINKYYEKRHEEYLKSHSEREIEDLKIELENELYKLKEQDTYLNFKKFENKELTVENFNDIDKIKDKYFQTDNYNYDSLQEIYHVLKEYKILVDYKYLFDDMKEKLDKKENLKDNMSKILKEISNNEKKLKSVNKRKNKKSIFGKIKNDEKWIFDYKKVLSDIIDNFSQLDNAALENIIYTRLSKDSSILDTLKLICSNYLYFVNKTLEQDNNENISVITSKHNELKEYVYNNNFYILNNIALLDERQMKELISNKYILENIKLDVESLSVDNINNTLSDIQKMVDYENILKANISLEDMSLFMKYNDLIKEK